MTIGELLTEQANSRPEAVALVDDALNRRLTFKELEYEVAHAAAWWKQQGLSRGQAVLVFVPMCADLYVAMLALFRIGAVAMFLDPSAGSEHIEQCCERWRPHAFLAIPKAHLLRFKSSALRKIPLKVTTRGWVPAARRWPQSWRTTALHESLAQPYDPALVTFT
ncbi:MAG: AMP-binding protein, partial [Opitutus sp.]